VPETTTCEHLSGIFPPDPARYLRVQTAIHDTSISEEIQKSVPLPAGGGAAAECDGRGVRHGSVAAEAGAWPGGGMSDDGIELGPKMLACSDRERRFILAYLAGGCCRRYPDRGL
jgi:hypothetical protein